MVEIRTPRPATDLTRTSTREGTVGRASVEALAAGTGLAFSIQRRLDSKEAAPAWGER